MRLIFGANCCLRLMMSAAVLLTCGILFAPAAHASCGDYVVWNGMPEEHDSTSDHSDSSDNTDSETSSSSEPPRLPLRSPCENRAAGCGPAVPPPITSALTTTIPMDHWLYFHSQQQNGAVLWHFVYIHLLLPDSHFPQRIFHPPRQTMDVG